MSVRAVQVNDRPVKQRSEKQGSVKQAPAKERSVKERLIKESSTDAVQVKESPVSGGQQKLCRSKRGQLH
jgi:hypothetical protein